MGKPVRRKRKWKERSPSRNQRHENVTGRKCKMQWKLCACLIVYATQLVFLTTQKDKGHYINQLC